MKKTGIAVISSIILTGALLSGCTKDNSEQTASEKFENAYKVQPYGLDEEAFKIGTKVIQLDEDDLVGLSTESDYNLGTYIVKELLDTKYKDDKIAKEKLKFLNGYIDGTLLKAYKKNTGMDISKVDKGIVTDYYKYQAYLEEFSKTTAMQNFIEKYSNAEELSKTFSVLTISNGISSMDYHEKQVKKYANKSGEEISKAYNDGKLSTEVMYGKKTLVELKKEIPDKDIQKRLEGTTRIESKSDVVTVENNEEGRVTSYIFYNIEKTDDATYNRIGSEDAFDNYKAKNDVNGIEIYELIHLIDEAFDDIKIPVAVYEWVIADLKKSSDGTYNFYSPRDVGNIYEGSILKDMGLAD